MVKKAQGIEDDGKKMGISLKELADALEHFKVATYRGRLVALNREY